MGAQMNGSIESDLDEGPTDNEIIDLIGAVYDMSDDEVMERLRVIVNGRLQ